MTDATDNAAQFANADAVLRLFPTRPRLLALGEPAHGEHTLLRLRNDLFRQLVEQAGYRTIAIESDCVAGLVVDDYLTTGAGTLDQVMETGFSHGWGSLTGNRELVRWMREYNDGRPDSEKLRFGGFDGPLEMTAAASPRQALNALHTYLARWIDTSLFPCTAGTLDRKLGADDRWTDPAAMMDPTKSVGQTPEARALRLIADDLAVLLETQVPHLIKVSSSDDLRRARLYGRTATGLLRYHFWMADTCPNRVTRLCALRDQLMAGNLLALAERGPVLAHAHNSHLQRDESVMQMWQGPVKWWSAGALVSAQLGDEYGFVATGLGTIRHHGVLTPPPDTIEGMLSALPEERCIIDSSFMAALSAARLSPRESPWFGYSPLDPAHLDGYDGIAFVRDTLQE